MRAAWLGPILVSALLLPGNSRAQEPDLSLGVLGGVGLADVSTDDPELGDTFRRTAPAVGFFMVLRANDRIEVAPNVLYQRQGFRVERPGTDAIFAVDHVTLPLLVRVRLRREGPLHPRVFVGPSIAFEVDCVVDGTVDGLAGSYPCEGGEIDVQTATTLYAIVFGGGVDWRKGRWALGVEGRFDYGLTELDVDPDSPHIQLRTYSILGSLSLAVGG